MDCRTRARPDAAPPAFDLQLLEPRILYSTYDIEGVQPAAVDQPQINLLFRQTPTGDPLGGNGPDDGLLVRGYLDTGSSGILISKESAEGLPLDLATQDGVPVEFTDVGVAGDQAFDVSTPYYGALAPVRSIFEDGIPVEEFDQSFGPVSVQVNQQEADFLTGELNIVGMAALQGKVVVMDPSPLNSDDIDVMQTYVYSPGTPYDPAGRGNDPGIPQVNQHVKLSYGDFAPFTTTTPAGATGPTLEQNPFIGPNPVRAAGVVDDTPMIQMAQGNLTASGSFLLDTGASASFVSEKIAGDLGVHYREGTFGTEAPVLVDANDVPVPNQFILPIGGIGGAIDVAGFFMDSLTLPTTEGNAIRFVNAPVLVLDITVTDRETGVETTLDGDFGMNYLVASYSIDGTNFGDATAGAFDWLTFDQPNGLLGLNLPGEATPGPSVTGVVIGDGTAQRSMVKQLTVNFDAPVTAIDEGAFELTRRPVGSGPTVAIPFSATLSADGLSATLTFTGADVVGGSLADGLYDFLVDPTHLRGAAGTAGTGDVQTTTFHRLFGDVDGNGSVGNLDYGRFRQSFGTALDSPGYDAAFDFDGNGVVGNADYARFRLRYGLTLA